MSEKIRCFLAVEMTEAVKRSLEELVSRLDLPQFHVRWVRPKNMHLTLRFLGDIPHPEVQAVSGAAREAASGIRAFALRLKGLGTFPSSGNPRIVWVGMEDDRAVMRLERQLTRTLGAIGIPPPDRPFRPHLTLGRVKSRRGIGELIKHLERNRTVDLGGMWAEQISFIRSELRPSGPLYTVLDRHPFQNESREGNHS